MAHTFFPHTPRTFAVRKDPRFAIGGAGWHDLRMGFFSHLGKAEPVEVVAPAESARQQIVAAGELGESLPALPSALESRDQALLRTTPRGVEILRAARQKPVFDAARQEQFLEEYARVPNLALAALRAGVLVPQVRAHAKNDPVFAEAMETAKNLASGLAEEEAFRRAVVGVDRLRYVKDVGVVPEKEYSDGLLVKILESKNPEYEKKTKVEGKHAVAFTFVEIANAVRQIGETIEAESE